MQRWMAIDDIMFAVIADPDCVVLPPEADPTSPSTTTSAPFLGILINGEIRLFVLLS